MTERVDVVVIGAGHAGLSASYFLARRNLPHVVLEQARIGETWRSRRWDSFTLVTPNWMLNLPGFPYGGDDPDGFLSRDQVVAYLESYAASFGAPVREGVQVDAVERRPMDSGYLVRTREGDFEAGVVVMATGFFEQPKIPPAAARISADVLQVHSSQYKRPEQLPAGAVLVVGSGQSGCQICEELYESGRKVYLSTGSAGRFVRRYRGRDLVWWANKVGFFDRTPSQLPSRQAMFAANPHLTGKGGGHTINLHRLAHDGVVLLGHFRDAQGDALAFFPDLKENLAKADKFAADIKSKADQYILESGLDVPEADPINTDEYYGDDGYGQNAIADLDLREAGITSIVWAAGFRADYGYVKLPILDADGYPIHDRGVTPYPGLYFVGVHYQHTTKSDLFFGVGEDAEHVVSHVADAMGHRSTVGG